MHSLKAIGATFRLQMVQSFSRPTFQFCVVIQPIGFALIFYMMYQYSGIPNFINHVVLGTGLCSLWSAVCFSSAGDIQREAYAGTLENLFSVPTSFYTIMIGKILANTVLGLLGMVLSSVTVGLLTGQMLVVENMGLFIGAFISMMLAFISVSLVISPVFTLSKRARVLMNCLEYPIYILCGFMVPVSTLPSGIGWIGYLIPTTWAIEVLRTSTTGMVDSKAVMMLFGLSSVYIIISLILFKRIDKLVRIHATLGVS
ncbi:MAG: ABC transporter permease [Cellulosilyticaceae bacterium]